MRQHLHGEHFLHVADELDERDGVAVLDVDHPHAAATFLHATRQRQAGEHGAFANLRQTNDGVTISEVEAAREARQLRHHLCRTTRLGAHQVAGTGGQKPQPIPIPARRMRHAQFVGQHLVAVDVHDQATGHLVLAPATGTVGTTQHGNIARPAFTETQTIQMATIRQFVGADERRSPARYEAVFRAQRAQA